MLAVLCRLQVNRHRADHAGNCLIAAQDLLADNHAGIHAAHRQRPQEALFRRVGNKQTYLVHVRGYHDTRRVRTLRALLHHDHVAHAIQLRIKPHVLKLRQQRPANGLFMTAGSPQLRQCFQIHRSSSHPASSSLR